MCNDATSAGESALWQLQLVWELAARRAADAHRLLHGGAGGESPIAPDHMLHVGTSLPGFLAAKACGARALLIDARPDPRKKSGLTRPLLELLELLESGWSGPCRFRTVSVPYPARRRIASPG